MKKIAITSTLILCCAFLVWRMNSTQGAPETPKPESWRRQYPALTFLWKATSLKQLTNWMEARGWHVEKTLRHKSNSNLACVVYDYGSGVELNFVQFYNLEQGKWMLRSTFDVGGKAEIKEIPEQGFSIYKDNQEVGVYKIK